VVLPFPAAFIYRLLSHTFGVFPPLQSIPAKGCPLRLFVVGSILRTLEYTPVLDAEKFPRDIHVDISNALRSNGVQKSKYRKGSKEEMKSYLVNEEVPGGR
jgi:hypothetical protein